MICRIYQWLIEKDVDDHGEVTNKLLLRHLEKCTACRQWRAVLLEIGRELRECPEYVSDVNIQQMQASIEQKVSSSRDYGLPEGASMFRTYRLRWAFAAAAAVMLIGAGLFSLYLQRSDENNYNYTLDSISRSSAGLQKQMPMLASLPESVMESEIQNVENEVRDGVAFVQNCIPQGLMAGYFSSENSEP